MEQYLPRPDGIIRRAQARVRGLVAAFTAHMMSAEYPLSVQISEVEREISMRKGVYANRILAGKMKQRDADNKIAIMKAVLDTLQACRELERGLDKAFNAPVKELRKARS